MVNKISNSLAYYVRERHFDSDRMAGTVAHWKNNGIKSREDENTTQSLSLIGNDGAARNTPPSMSFAELLDVVNPLHHLPIVGNVYRNMTGDQISPVAQIVGGSIYGGPIGGLTSLASVAVEEHSGKDVPSAIKSSMNLDEARYFIEEDERTAGIRKRPDSKDEIASLNESVEVAISQPIPEPSSKPFIQKDIDWDEFENEKREPVTRVSIDLAAAPVKKQQWNFNA